MELLDLHFEKFYLLVRKRQYDAALALLYDAKNDRINRQFKTDSNHAWYCIGDVYFKVGDFSHALLAFKKALRTRKDDYQALWAIAECYSEMHKPRFAERYFRKALSYEPKNKDLIYNLGNTLFDQGKYDEALRRYKAIGRSERGLYELARKNVAVISNLLRARHTGKLA